jgi:hypothetical protein
MRLYYTPKYVASVKKTKQTVVSIQICVPVYCCFFKSYFVNVTEYIELKRQRTYWNWNLTFCSPFNPYPANMENTYGEPLIMPTNGRWGLTCRLKG